MHYRLMYPSEYLNAADLNDKDVKVVIEKVELEDVPGVDGSKKRKPVIWFTKAKKRFVCPKTCAKRIAQQFGPNTDDWIGQTITLYATTCTAFGQQVECVRVR